LIKLVFFGHWCGPLSRYQIDIVDKVIEHVGLALLDLQVALAFRVRGSFRLYLIVETALFIPE
jgi:hypothetical protein